MTVKRHTLFFNNLALLLTSCLLLAFFASDVRAQQRAAQPARSAVRLRDMPRLGRSSLVRTPEYQNNVSRTVRGARRREWAVFEVGYETAPEWIDELSFTFFVMAQDKDRQFSFFEVSVTYVDLAKGDHTACVILPPAAVERYGESNAFGVEVYHDGERVDFKSTGKNISATDEWWKFVDGKPNITKRSGYLADRSKTPFALAYIDDYEAVR